MSLKIIFLLSISLTAVYANQLPSYTPPPPPPPPVYAAPAPEEHPKYDFTYGVKDDYTGNDFGHQESRDGYDTQGTYYVLLPDGRRQTVTYTVNGDSGYVAQVTYEGEAQPYTAAPAPPKYTPAPPAYTPPPPPPPPPVYA